jgi:hypothetical protein
VGTVRKGPLAAFVLIAIVAAVLLVTSVRSQATPRWLTAGGIPAALVVGPPATDPHLWLAVGSRLHQAVPDGVVLAQKPAQSTTTEAGGSLLLPAAPAHNRTLSARGRAPTHPTHPAHAPQHHAPAAHHTPRTPDGQQAHHSGHGKNPGDHVKPPAPGDAGGQPGDQPGAGSPGQAASHGRGHHLRSHTHPHGAPATHPTGPADPASESHGHGKGHDKGPDKGHGHADEHGHAHGQTHGHSHDNGHGHGHSHDNGHGHSHDNGHGHGH